MPPQSRNTMAGFLNSSIVESHHPSFMGDEATSQMPTKIMVTNFDTESFLTRQEGHSGTVVVGGQAKIDEIGIAGFCKTPTETLPNADYGRFKTNSALAHHIENETRNLRFNKTTREQKKSILGGDIRGVMNRNGTMQEHRKAESRVDMMSSTDELA